MQEVSLLLDGSATTFQDQWFMERIHLIMDASVLMGNPSNGKFGPVALQEKTVESVDLGMAHSQLSYSI